MSESRWTRPRRLRRLMFHRRYSPQQNGCTKSENDLEELNSLPLSRIIRVERCVLHPDPVASRRPRVEHLQRVATGTECFRKCPLDFCPFDRCWLFNRSHRSLPADRCSKFLRGSSRHQGGDNCDHQSLHVSLSVCGNQMLPITIPAHNISFDGFS